MNNSASETEDTLLLYTCKGEMLRSKFLCDLAGYVSTSISGEKDIDVDIIVFNLVMNAIWFMGYFVLSWDLCGIRLDRVSSDVSSSSELILSFSCSGAVSATLSCYCSG